MSRYDHLMNFEFPEVEHSFTPRDCIIYALGVGAGSAPGELAYVDEHNLRVLPTMAVVLAYPGNWYCDLGPGLDFVKTVHAAEQFVIHRPLPCAATIVARPKITAIYDKGEGRGALVVSKRGIYDKSSGDKLASVTQTAFCRGDGGLGGPVIAAPEPRMSPARPPDHRECVPTDARAALIYRLSGDYNRLHLDAAFAAKAGFAGPILHGLSTYGHIGRAIIRTFCATGSQALTSMDCRFRAAVFPGDAIDLLLWRDDTAVYFQAFVGGRLVVDNGVATLGL